MDRESDGRAVHTFRPVPSIDDTGHAMRLQPLSERQEIGDGCPDGAGPKRADWRWTTHERRLDRCPLRSPSEA
jgi:hypothetical protein